MGSATSTGQALVVLCAYKFHKNEDFYNISNHKSSREGQKPSSAIHMKASLTVHKDWKELTQAFNRLFKASHQEPLRGDSLLQSDHGQHGWAHLPHQALADGASGRFADLVLGYRVLNAQDPTSEEAYRLGLRAQFEEKRYQEIRREDAYKEESDYEQKYKLREEARRLSTIEGRLYGQELVKALEQEKILERTLSFYTEAVREYNQHVTKFKEIAQIAQDMMGCSPSVAHQTTLMRIQFEERFGVDPSISEYMKFAKIAELQEKTRQDLIEKMKEIGANTSITQEIAVRSLLSAEREELKRMSVDQIVITQEDPSLREALRSELVVHLRQEDMATIHRDQERQAEQTQEKSLEKSQELELER